MRISTLLPKTFLFGALVASAFVPATAQDSSAAKTQAPSAAASSTADSVARLAKSLPETVGDFRAQGATRPVTLELGEFAPADFGIVAARARDYAATDGAKLRVQLTRTSSASAAYSLLKFDARRPAPSGVGLIEELGALGVNAPNRIRFVKGATFVDVSGTDATGVANSGGDVSRAGTGTGGQSALVAFAQQLAVTLEGEAGEIPPLVLHLPEWERVNATTDFAVTLPALQKAAGNRPALEAVSFDGGTEAVTNAYDAGRLVVVEFTTPQIATDTDARIRQRIEELRAQGQAVPAAYRRVGNYSVFVFDAPNETAAAQLIDGVKWEKDVRWLSGNPNALRRAQRAYYEMTGSTVLNVLIVSGVSIVACLGIGGLLGGAVFLYRRAQSATTQVYTDAGGMVRLNIDDITHETDPARLLGSGGKR